MTRSLTPVHRTTHLVEVPFAPAAVRNTSASWQTEHHAAALLCQPGHLSVDSRQLPLGARSRTTSSLARRSRRDRSRDHPRAGHYAGGRNTIEGVSHQNGTVRFGTDSATSALDVNCKMHDLDNRYVVDSSFFCSSSAVNPTLTIIANALRVADHIDMRISV
jgi:GMC oxidoreductase